MKPETRDTFVLSSASQFKDYMGNKYYIIAMLLTFIWVVGFLIYDLSPLIHILLFIAFIIMLVRIVGEE